MNYYGKLPGKRCVILGSGDIGLIMARRLSLNGVHVAGVYEVLPTCSGLTRNVVQCLHDYNIPLHLSHTIVNIHGKARVTGVTIAPVGPPPTFTPDMSKAFDVECDTVLLSVGLIPENELSVSLGVSIDNATRGAVITEDFMTKVPGIFACGNVLQVHDLADNCWDEGLTAGAYAGQYVRERKEKSSAKSLALVKGENVLYVLPQTIVVPAEPADPKATVTVSLRVNCALRPATVKIGELDSKVHKVALPGEMIRQKIPLAKIQEWVAAHPDATSIQVVAPGTRIPQDDLQKAVCTPPSCSSGTPTDSDIESERHIVCLCCPNGCALTLKHKGGEVTGVTGWKCRRGEAYATQEFKKPLRVFSMTMPVEHALVPMLPVKLSAPIPKERIFEAAAEILKLKTVAPVKRGQVMLKNVLGLDGVDVVACRSLDSIAESCGLCAEKK
jgi:CxxC motif-containing protein